MLGAGTGVPQTPTNIRQHSNGTAMTEQGRATGSGNVFRASGETSGPWLAILRRCSIVCGVALLALAVVGLVVAGMPAAGSALLGGVLVVVFFGISLLIGHLVGRRNPSAALGAFMAGYAVKVVVLGVLAFGLGAPAWLDGTWFLIAVVASVILWQVAELHAFSRLRFQLYADPETPPGGAPGGPRG